MSRESDGPKKGGGATRIPAGDPISKKGQEPRPKVPPPPKVDSPPSPPPAPPKEK